jgi:hypothetical protein
MVGDAVFGDLDRDRDHASAHAMAASEVLTASRSRATVDRVRAPIRWWRRPWAVAACIGTLVPAVGCGTVDVDEGDSFVDGEPQATAASDSGASTSSTSDGDTTWATDTSAEDVGEATAATADDGAILLDVGAGGYDLGGAALGCQAIDFLFVVDDSGSMAPYQANLIASFPAFVEGIEASLDTVDGFHVAVTTTDAYLHNAPPCDWLGSSVIRTGGASSSGQTCGPYAEGHNYMTDADDLAATFACAAQVGTEGDAFEQPMGAVVNAMYNTTPGTAPCNEDLLRTNALLVVVVITDEWDGPGDPEATTSPGTPEIWHDAVIQAKGGHAENAAVVMLTNYEGGPCPPDMPASDGQNLVAFTQLFGDHGFVAGICEPDYAAAFDEAVDVVVDACKDFVPPG